MELFCRWNWKAFFQKMLCILAQWYSASKGWWNWSQVSFKIIYLHLYSRTKAQNIKCLLCNFVIRMWENLNSKVWNLKFRSPMKINLLFYSGRCSYNLSDSTSIWSIAIWISTSSDDLSTLPDEHYNKDQIITWI